MNNPITYQQKKHSPLAICGGILFIACAVLATIGLISILLELFSVYNEALKLVKNSGISPKEAQSQISALKSEFYKQFVALSVINSLTILSYAFIGIMLILRFKGLTVLGLGILTLSGTASLIASMVLDSYTKFLVLLADIVILISVGMIFSIIADANRVRVRYIPPKRRYVPIILYAAVSAVKRILLVKLAGFKYTFSEQFGALLAIILLTAAFFCAVQVMVKPITPVIPKETVEKTKYDNWHGKVATAQYSREEMLVKYRALYENGVISKEEYEIKKKELK